MAAELTPEQKAQIAAIDAQIAALREEEQSSPPPANPEEQENQGGFLSELAGGTESVLGNIGQWGKDIMGGAWNGVKAIPEMAANVVNPYRNLPYTLDDKGQVVEHPERINAAMDSIAHPLSNAASYIGLQGPVRAAEDYLTGNLQSGAEYGKMTRENIAGLAGGYGLLKAAPIALNPKAVAVAAKDRLLGMPENEILMRQAPNADIVANKLNYGVNNTAAERNAVRNAASTTEAFNEVNPTQGIDASATSTLSGREQMLKVRENLNTANVGATKSRQAILNEASTREAALKSSANSQGLPYNNGIKFEDIPSVIETEKGPYGLEHIANTVAGGPEGVNLATQFVREKFGIVDSGLVDEFENPIIAASKAISASEANTLRQQIDTQIREIGGFDSSYWTQKGMSPSVADSYAEALRFYRQQLDGVVKGHIEKLLGPEKATQFTKDGNIISMANSHIPMIDRFMFETGQAYVPTSGRRMPTGGGLMSRSGHMVDKVVEEVTPGAMEAKIQTGPLGLQREANAVRQLQKIVEFRNQPPQILPRGTAQIRMSAQHMNNFTNLAISLGLVKNGNDIAKLPDPMFRALGSQIAAVVPEAFETNPDKVNTWDGEIQNPQDLDMLKYEAAKLPAQQRAVTMMELNQRKYTSPGVVDTPVSAPKPEFDSLSSLIPDDMSQVQPNVPMGPMTPIQQLEKMTAIHEKDIQ